MKISQHTLIQMDTHRGQLPIVSGYQAAEHRGDLVKLARLGRTGEKHESPGYGNLYIWRDGPLVIYVDEAHPFLMVLNESEIVCFSADSLLKPGPWLDRALVLAAAIN